MPTPMYTVTCLSNRLIAKDIYETRFTKPEGMSFKAGQFVLFQVPLIDSPSDLQPRAYSIASAPSESELLFVFKMKEGGRASRWVAEQLQEGDTIQMQGPFGLFTIKDEPGREILMICTSTGIAPFRSQIIDLMDRGAASQIDLVYGVRSEEDLFWAEELEALAQKSDQFFLHLALSQPSSAWTGHRGRVQTLVPLIMKDFARKDVYVCGSPDMTKEVKELCLGQWGVEKKRMHVEGYI